MNNDKLASKASLDRLRTRYDTLEENYKRLQEGFNKSLNVIAQLGLALNIVLKRIGVTNAEYQEALAKTIAENSDRIIGGPAEVGDTGSDSGQRQPSLPSGEGDGVSQGGTPSTGERESISPFAEGEGRDNTAGV